MISAKRRYFNRDLSWLSFNQRVLEEALDVKLPLYERIKFIAIHASNLDEFHRVRVSYLETLDKLGYHNEEENSSYGLILSVIRKETVRQAGFLRSIMVNNIVPELKKNKIILYQSDNEVHAKHIDFINEYFNTYVVSFLQPISLHSGQIPFLEDRALYFICQLVRKKQVDQLLLLNIPTQALPRFILLPQIGATHYIIYLDDIIRIGARQLFLDFSVKNFFSIKINRDAGINLDEDSGEIAIQMKESLKQRAFGAPSRFQYDPKMPKAIIEFCEQHFGLEKEEMTSTGRYQNMSDFFGFPNPVKPALEQQRWKPLKHKALSGFSNYFDAMDPQDFILHFPYQSYDHVLIFFNQAVLDPFVTEIMATFYRVAADSHIVNALISASKNGKKVKAFVEVKARFDEANNLLWAAKMKEAGVEIFYSLPDIKVHAKTALITRVKNGETKTYAFYGTGNFNEKTAGIYSDIGMLSSNPDMNAELKRVFNFLYKQKAPGKFKHLLVSQFNIVEGFKQLIKDEIEWANAGKKAAITIKLNNLEDIEMIEALYAASNAGVKINLIVRSICRLKPGVKGMSENIRLVRVVGRYLEHCRIFIFNNNGNTKVFLGSADWMKRNLHSRVEVVFPVYDAKAMKEILFFIKTQLDPYQKTTVLTQNLEAIHFDKKEVIGNDAQEAFYKFITKIK